jgi:sulfur-oxidizing protein SoxY
MRNALLAIALLLVGLAGPAGAQKAAYDPWPDLVVNVFDGRPIEDGSGVIALEAPARAEDAAIVPMTIRNVLPADSPLRVEKVTLVIDNNPSPVAAVFGFGGKGRVEAISTRVRVDSYTNVHVVAELSDGSLHSVARYVKASGGCSAPAAKVASDAAKIGEMKLVRYEGAPAGSREAQVMIRHPNNSGLQMDPVNNYYIPAFFIQDLQVKLGDEPLLTMEGGISISENPTFRFTYSGLADDAVSVEAKDTEGGIYARTWSAAGSS